MSWQESDREDLIREATALVRRGEWRSPVDDDVVTAGFRRDGSLSLYFGGDPVYHFDSTGRLKRAFRLGRLYRTQGTTLAELTRQRTTTSTDLLRRDLEQRELDDFLVEMTERIEKLRKDLNERHQGISRLVPQNDTEFESDFAMALQGILMVAATKSLAPRYRGKR